MKPFYLLVNTQAHISAKEQALHVGPPVPGQPTLPTEPHRPLWEAFMWVVIIRVAANLQF